MTVSTTTRRVTYTGTGANTVLSVPYVFINSSDLTVVKTVTATGVETTLTMGVHYSVSGGDYATGTVTPIDGATDFPATVTWEIVRYTPLTQATDYTENDAFTAEAHERALDKLTLLAQERYDDDFAVDSDVSVSAFAETVLDDTSASAMRTTIDAMQDVFTTRGDLVRAGAAAAPERVAIGTSGYVLTSDGTDPGWAVRPYPPGHFCGGAITRASTTTITFGTVKARSSADEVNAVLASAYTKSSAGEWAAGTGQNGMGYGLTVANNTWYHLFYIMKADGTTDCGFDTSATCANLLDTRCTAYLAGYRYYVYAGVSVRTDGSAQFPDFIHDHETVWLATPVLDETWASNTTAATITLDYVPTGFRVNAHLTVVMDGTGGGQGVYIAPYDADTVTNPALAAAPGAHMYTSATTDLAAPVTVLTDTSARFTIDSAGPPGNTYINVLGWTYPRGKTRIS